MKTGFFIVAVIAAQTLSWLTCEKSLCSLWIMMHLLGSKAGSVGLGGRLAGGGCCCGGCCCCCCRCCCDWLVGLVVVLGAVGTVVVVAVVVVDVVGVVYYWCL